MSKGDVPNALFCTSNTSDSKLILTLIDLLNTCIIQIQGNNNNIKISNFNTFFICKL